MIAAKWNYKQRHSTNGSIPYRMAAAIIDNGEFGTSSCSLTQLSVGYGPFHTSHSTVWRVEGFVCRAAEIRDVGGLLLCVDCTVSLREGGFGSFVRLFGWFDSVFWPTDDAMIRFCVVLFLS